MNRVPGGYPVHPVHLGFLAIELTRNRAREAADERLVVAARQADRHNHRPQPPVGPLRRTFARSAAALSRSAADVARRLDRRTADELVDCPDAMSGSSAAA
jgi:transposase